MNIGFVKAQSDNLSKVTVLMVTEFFSESEYFDLAETSGVKARRAEREDYGDAAVGYVELRREGQFCAVRGRVCPEHRVNSKAYAVSIMVDEENESIKSVTCEDCAASASGCKHAIAVLMWVHRRSEETEPTATVCFWKKARFAQVASNVRSLKAKDMRQSKVQTELPDNTTFFKTLLDKMKKRQFDSQIFRYYIKTDSNNMDVESFLRFASDTMTEDRCNLARNETQNQSESKLWNELRMLKIRDTEAMERGRRLEKDVKLTEELLKTNIQDCGLLLDSRFPIIGASPDGVGNDFVVEIKCPMTCKAKSRYIKENNQVANKFMAQIQLQMFMKKVKKGFFCVATHDFETSQSIKLICVEYDEDLVLDLIEKVMGFWKENIYSLIFNAATG
ncbi:uncharacterized protein LOC124295573 [Neodiprion lecontei]|uniref:Uncharacterized protein LOC124295573 n=1 Tax=Neodiprion lecontei TaxID=441921 RepID=A0ABM3GNW0_NEOLC|nr:uncharacterized protein LOC124295573 [Neodiprion lecontei]